jgi:hypothetical protein
LGAAEEGRAAMRALVLGLVPASSFELVTVGRAGLVGFP